MKSRKIKFFVSCIFLLMIAFSNAQNAEFTGQSVYTINDNSERDIPLQVAFTSPTGFTGDLFIIVPQGVDFSPLAPGVPTISVDNAFNITSVTREADIGLKKVVKISFSFTSPSSSYIGTLTLKHVKFPIGNLCGDKNYPIELQLKNSSGTITHDTDSKTYTIKKREASLSAVHQSFSVYNCRDPFFHSFYVYGSNTSGPIKVTYVYNSAKFTIAGVFKRNGNALSAQTYTTTSNPGEIVINQTSFYERYQIYFNPIVCNASNDQSFSVNAVSTEVPECPLTSSFTQTNSTVTGSCCGEGSGTPRPFIENDYYAQCAEECTLTLYVNVNNLTGTSYSNLLYNLDLPASATITSVYPSAGTITGSDYQLPLSLAAGTVYSFYVNYTLSTPVPTSITANQTLNVTGPPVVNMDTKPFVINYSNQASCLPYAGIREWAMDNTTVVAGGTQNGYALQNGTSRNIETYIVVDRFNSFGMTNFDFDYIMNEYLKINPAVTPTYYYGPFNTPNTLTPFTPTNSHIAGYVLNPDNKKMTFKGINIPKQCSSNDVLVIKLELISNAQMEIGSKLNIIKLASTNQQQFVYVYTGMINWQASGNELLELYVAPSCDSLGFIKRETALPVTAGVPFYYNYVLDNVGAARINGSLMVGSLPHNGDKLISIPTTSRGSNFTFNCPTNIAVVLQTISNSVITNRVLAPGDYELTFSTQAGICSQELGSATNPCPAAPLTPCSGTNNYFKLKLKPSFGGLPAFTKLVLRMQVEVPVGTPIGAIGIGTFAGSYAGNSFVQESGPGSVEVSTTSPCTPKPPCLECENSFAPLPGKDYVLSAWVKEQYVSPSTYTYTNAGIILSFKGAYSSQDVTLDIFKGTGQIIDGWQRIERVFTVPTSAVKIIIKLSNGAAGNAYFDDIRVHPFDSNMKSFVYDPKTLRLAAEMDERNYATFYEYNEEGALVRVKKETERGVMTIKESRNATRKKP